MRSFRVYSEMGGSIDILLGITYNSIFPQPLHSLETGLTIYKLVITSHDPKYSYTIGGPHESFLSMANYFGGFRIFFANLQQQLESYRNFGPPKISKSLLTEEDVNFAEQFDIENYRNFELLDAIDAMDDNSPDLSAEFPVNCGLCNAPLSKNDLDEELACKKSLQKAQEEGLSIEYRCPKCRACSDCRNSYETERLSLREEGEDLKNCDSFL